MNWFLKIPDSHSQMFFKTGVLKNFANFIGEHPVLESLFNKVAGLQAGNLIKKKTLHRCILVKFAKSLRVPFFYRTPPYEAHISYLCLITLQNFRNFNYTHTRPTLHSHWNSANWFSLQTNWLVSIWVKELTCGLSKFFSPAWAKSLFQ